jgi:hypothetical protein
MVKFNSKLFYQFQNVEASQILENRISAILSKNIDIEIAEYRRIEAFENKKYQKRLTRSTRNPNVIETRSFLSI